MSFAILHSHSEYSARDSLIRVEDMPKAAKARGWTACALTDHGVIEGLYEFHTACKKEGIKPILGIELYIRCPDMPDRINHLTVLAKGPKGFMSIASVLSQAHKIGYNARQHRAEVPLDLAYEKLEDVVILTGCFSSPFWRRTDAAADDLVRFIEKFGDDFYFEYQGLHDWNEQCQLNRTIMDCSREFGRPVVVTPDCHFLDPSEQPYHEKLLAITFGKPFTFSTHLNYIMTPKEIVNGLIRSGVPENIAQASLEETDRIAEKVKDWSWTDIAPAQFPDVGGSMAELAWAGFENRGLSGDDYRARMNTELKVFTEAGVDRYMLLARHCVNLFKEHGAEVGPRGSVGGSLVSYCLGLSNLDPILHGLSYERFYAPGRKGWPDVDVDVDAEFRTKLPAILRQEFGDDNVAQISNFTTFKLRTSVKDAARAYGIKLADASTFSMAEKDAKDVLDILPGQELAEKSPEALAFARKLVGRIRQFGAHAGGFIISTEPLTTGRGCVVNRGKDKALCWDMEVAEKLGYIKFDFLGIDSLSAIRAVGQAININWNDVPLDDKDVINDIGSGKTAGVPQFLTAGLRTFVERLQPENFEDLVWANAAFRPGALGQMPPEELAATYKQDKGSIIVYQEEIMELCVGLAGFSWTEADGVRKVAAKSKGVEELEKWRKPFVDGCIKKGTLTENEANDLWTKLAGFSRYAFNKSHASAYTWSAYRIAWAKRHHPVETFAALLNADPENAEALMDEAPEFGVAVLQPEANHSGIKWLIEPEGIRTPLGELPLMDARIAKAILLRREKGLFKDKDDFKKRMDGIKYPERIADALFSGRAADARFAFPLSNTPKKLIPKDFDRKVIDCDACVLRAGCRRPVVPEINRTNILIVGEAPGYEENRAGRPFVGRSGDLIMEILNENGIEREDVSWSNSVHCFPAYRDDMGKYHALKDGEIAKSEGERVCAWVHDEVKYLQPPLILAVGKKAYCKLTGQPITKTSIMKVNASVVDKDGSILIPCVHPAAVLRDPNTRPEIERAIKKFAKFFRMLVPEKKTVQDIAKA